MRILYQIFYNKTDAAYKRH